MLNSSTTMEQSSTLANQSVEQANNAAESLTNITENISQITTMNIDIADTASKQVLTTAEISMHLLKINEMAAAVITGTTDLKSSTADLSQMAGQLNVLVSNFKLDIDTSVNNKADGGKLQVADDNDNTELF